MTDQGASDSAIPDGETHSLILIGYGNAMFNLGRRYEAGQGTARNTDEAIRCYFKAAKLGNHNALARLAPHLSEPAARPDAAVEEGSGVAQESPPELP